VWKLPEPKTGENNQELEALCKFEGPEDSLKGQECRCIDWHPNRSERISVVYSGGFSVWDLKSGTPQVFI
jgi:hypothetical protein